MNIFQTISLALGLICCGSLTTLLHAQSDTSSTGNSLLSRVRKKTERLDTIGVRYFLQSDGVDTLRRLDTILRTVHVYNPARRGTWEMAHLGNVGSATVPLVYQPRMRQGFFVGIEQFDVYRTRPEDTRYYVSKYPFTELSYSQSKQSNSTTGVKFGSRLMKGLYLSVDYNLVLQFGWFPNQYVRNENFGLGLRYKSADGRYLGTFNYLTNKIRSQENGGLADPAALKGAPPAFPEDLSTRLMGNPAAPGSDLNAYSEQRFSNFELNQRFQLFKTDSSSPSNRLFSNGTVKHELAYRREIFKYFDQKIDSSEFAYYRYFNDNSPRGIRQYINHKTIHNRLAYEQAFGTWVGVEAGVNYDLHLVNQEPNEFTVHNTFLTAKVRTLPNSKLGAWKADAYGHLGITGNAGDYAIRANATLSFGALGALELTAFRQTYAPSLVSQRLFVTQAVVWDTTLSSKVSEQTLGAAYVMRKWRLKAAAEWHLLDGMVYYDSLARPAQSGAFSVLQFSVFKDVTFLKRWHLDFKGVYQVMSRTDILRLPQWWMGGKFYFEGPILKKKIELRVGIDARFNANYTLYQYMPVTGQFYQPSPTSPKANFYPVVDFFISGRVRTFNVYLLAENMLQYGVNRGLYVAENYALPWRMVRFGVTWRLAD